jgi:hypothetical protein
MGGRRAPNACGVSIHKSESRDARASEYCADLLIRPRSFQNWSRGFESLTFRNSPIWASLSSRTDGTIFTLSALGPVAAEAAPAGSLAAPPARSRPAEGSSRHWPSPGWRRASNCAKTVFSSQTSILPLTLGSALALPFGRAAAMASNAAALIATRIMTAPAAWPFRHALDVAREAILAGHPPASGRRPVRARRCAERAFLQGRPRN